MVKGLFDYSSEDEVNSISGEEYEQHSKALLPFIEEAEPRSSLNPNLRLNYGINVNISCSDNYFCSKNLSERLNSDDDSYAEHLKGENSGKIDFLSSKLQNIDLTRESCLKEAKLTPVEFSFDKKKEYRGLFDYVSSTEAEESNDSSDTENYNFNTGNHSLNTCDYRVPSGLAKHLIQMEPGSFINSNEKGNQKRYFDEQGDTFSLRSSHGIKQDIKEEFTTESLQKTYVQSCRVMESVFSDLDEGFGNSLQGKEIKSARSGGSNPALPNSQRVQNECKMEEIRNLESLPLVTARDNRKGNGRSCHQGHFVPQGQIRCQETCNKPKDCKIHQCEINCESPHYSHRCNEEVVRKLSCGHEINVSCGQTTITERCYAKTKTTFKCGHEGVGKCGQASTTNCGARIKTKLACGHSTVYTCNGGQIICQERCPKKLACGHGCPNFCSEPCIVSAQCQLCIDLDEETQKRRIKTYQDLATQKAIEFKNEATKFEIIDLDPSSSAFLDVTDKVLKYIQPTHSWYPEVTSVKEVFNATLLQAFYSCQANLIGASNTREKFHGTNAEACEKIIHNGFRLPRNDGQARMFGCGIYFATDSSKSAQNVYTKGSNILLLCDVSFGKEMKVSSPQYDLNLETIKSLGYDSVFAPRNTKNSGGVLFDEFVIYDPRQAYPRYVINYEVTQLSISAKSTQATTFQKFEILPSRSFDPSNELDYHFRVAEAQFGRHCKTREVVKVTYVVNPVIESQFVKTLKEFKAKYGNNSDEAKPILAFHGTPVESNIDSILKDNFKSSYIKTTAYGHGHYFSEFPDTSLGYAGGVKALILCKILPGKSQDVTSRINIAAGYDSNRVGKDSMGRGNMIIISNEKQILPRYVVYLN